MSKKEIKPPINISKSESRSIPFHVNMIGLVISFFITLFFYKNFPSYQWVKDELIKENLKLIKKNSRLTIDDKLEAKIGYDYSVLKMIKNATPDTAIILMPNPDSCLAIRKREKGQNLNGGGIQHKVWSEYYLYPRKLVYKNQKDPDSARVNYIAILAGQGYEMLNVPDSQKQGYTVIKFK